MVRPSPKTTTHPLHRRLIPHPPSFRAGTGQRAGRLQRCRQRLLPQHRQPADAGHSYPASGAGAALVVSCRMQGGSRAVAGWPPAWPLVLLPLSAHAFSLSLAPCPSTPNRPTDQPGWLGGGALCCGQPRRLALPLPPHLVSACCTFQFVILWRTIPRLALHCHLVW